MVEQILKQCWLCLERGQHLGVFSCSNQYEDFKGENTLRSSHKPFSKNKMVTWQHKMRIICTFLGEEVKNRRRWNLRTKNGTEGTTDRKYEWKIGKALLPFFKSATPKTNGSLWSLVFSSLFSSLLSSSSAVRFSLSDISGFLLLSWRPLLWPINNTARRQKNCRRTQKNGDHPETQDLSLYLIFSWRKSWNVNKISMITAVTFGMFELVWI